MNNSSDLNSARLVPVNGCWVKDKYSGRAGKVKNSRRLGGGSEVQVAWHGEGEMSWTKLDCLTSGFQLGMEVQENPYSRTRKSLGEGVVLDVRTIGERDQVLVEYYETGNRVWLPYEHLKPIKGVRQRFILGQIGDENQAEKFRMRSLALAITMWNQNTGSLSRLEIDPLPHQIHLVHHILASGNLNWLIADDVGLGKTIEVGMLLAALEQRGIFRRILIITPAGLVRQWQEELHFKFRMSDFQIYGSDFEINNPRHWKLYDHVIGSIDKFKSEESLELLMKADNWDLIIFDEAHRLSRRQYGMKLESSQRFKLAATLRHKTDSLLLLSATPHQGMTDKFQALLELLRPELKEDIRNISMNPEVLRDIIIRNNKADVTDVDGNFIFRGKITRAISVDISQDEEEFDGGLRKYLIEGYAAGKRMGRKGIAIGFVMTVYRKLAASSIAAINAALRNRISRLRGEQMALERTLEEDERYFGEYEEMAVEHVENEFFEGEIRMIEELLYVCERILAEDSKLKAFLEKVIPAVGANPANEKILIFTEYRATQNYIMNALQQRFGHNSVVLINGGMSYQEREESIGKFELDARFLISTEAGGEGLNLHRRCHIMINYDLPWNPMRLVQRIGRLYRYGQQHNVVVFNLHAPQTMDSQIMDLMYTRISQVVVDMASVSEEYKEGLQEEIMGELADMLDIEHILQEAMEVGIDRTEKRIEEALERAREAVEKQQELFKYVSGFNPLEAKKGLIIVAEHVKAFVLGMCEELGIDLLEKSHGGRMMHLRLPDTIRQVIGTLKQRLAITFDRDFAATRRDVEMMDFQSYFFRYLIDVARSYDFGGFCASLKELPGVAWVTAVLRWQNDQGIRLREEYTVIQVSEDEATHINSDLFIEWLLSPAQAGSQYGDRNIAKKCLISAEKAMDERLSELSNLNLHPENRQLINAAWVDPGD